jgi:hypothetical protein
MEYFAFEDEHNPGDWCVEARSDGGQFFLTFFVGTNAKERAQEYAAWKASAERSSRHAAL